MEAVIGAGELERAERTLQVVYGGDLGRQLDALKIERDAWDNFLKQNMGILESRYADAISKMDPRLIPALNTMMTHCLFVGVIAGHNQLRVIE